MKLWVSKDVNDFCYDWSYFLYYLVAAITIIIVLWTIIQLVRVIPIMGGIKLSIHTWIGMLTDRLQYPLSIYTVSFPHAMCGWGKITQSTHTHTYSTHMKAHTCYYTLYYQSTHMMRMLLLWYLYKYEYHNNNILRIADGSHYYYYLIRKWPFLS